MVFSLPSLIVSLSVLTGQAFRGRLVRHIHGERSTRSFVRATCRDHVSWSSSRDLSVGGASRSYHVLQPDPALADSKVPAIMMLHGLGSNAMGFACEGSMAKEGRSSGYMMVYLEGSLLVDGDEDDNRVWNSGSSYGTSATSYPERSDDIAYAKAVVQDLIEKFNVDPARIYVAGISNGGSMAFRMSCELADFLAGAAIVHGSLESRDARACAAQKCEANEDYGYLECSWNSTVPQCGAETWVEELPEVFECNSAASIRLPRLMFEGTGNRWRMGGVNLGVKRKPVSLLRKTASTPEKGFVSDSFDLKGCSSEGNYPPSDFARKYLVGLQSCGEGSTSFSGGDGKDRTECTNFQGCKSGNLTFCTTVGGGDWWYGPDYDVVTPCKFKGEDSEKDCSRRGQVSEFGGFSHSIDITKQVLSFFKSTASSRS
eukprot:TRINITY_DN76325_c0_g1_i1.p1 TRINITY_DN76325_c0_g1~~TRINITY_DN76325_c0_g1_i1.p1  ORF type:complete len:459 (+),score=63.64 TRINITY_DN76325_c0_g1_i1:92-1378(+)